MPYGIVHDTFGFPANNMASSSGRAAFSSGPSSAHPVTIALSSNNSDDRRIIELLPGQICKIGRSSKSELKNMRPSRNNALFDCAVVSRNHAELRGGREVSLIDRNSLHGTTVNGRRLEPGENFTLKTGDVIKLGDTISRGPDTHDGVSLTFRRIDDIVPRRRLSPSGSHVFEVKVPSDTDLSDLESDQESIVSVADQRSSAKTTPEQPKMKLGSQESPINVDAAPTNSASIINLINDDDNAEDPPTAVQKHTTTRIIPDSIAFPYLHPVPVSALEADNGEEQPLESEVEETDFGYDRHDMIENDDNRSSSPINFDVESEVDEEVDDLFRCRSNRQPSVELGIADEPSQESIVTKPRYDPVRSSQPPADTDGNIAAINQSPAKGPSTYTYGPSAFQNMFVNPATDFPSSSRWDVFPAAPSISSAVQDSHFEFAGSPGQPSSNMPSIVARAFRPGFSAYPPPPPASYGARQDNAPTQAGFGYSVFDASPHQNFSFNTAAEVTQDPADSTLASQISLVKGKISIDDIVEPQQAANNTTEDSMIDADTAEVRKETSAERPTESRSPTKRKADEMEAREATEPATKRAATLDASTSTRHSQRASRRRAPKRSMVRKIATNAARYAAGAAIGSAATIAFVASDYGSELIYDFIRWLE